MKCTANIQSCIKSAYAETVNRFHTILHYPYYCVSKSRQLMFKLTCCHLFTLKTDAIYSKSDACKMFCTYKKIPPFHITFGIFHLLFSGKANNGESSNAVFSSVVEFPVTACRNGFNYKSAVEKKGANGPSGGSELWFNIRVPLRLSSEKSRGIDTQLLLIL